MGEHHLDPYVDTQVSPSGGYAAERLRTRNAGDRIAGRYVLERYLARGGMAEVWLARHESLKTEVAIKFVDEHLTRDREGGASVLERFRFEAQISARLGARTRHVVAVQDAGTHEETPYLVMEYVPGRTLEAEVEAGGAISPDRFANVLDQVADALDAAHALGIIHRDLKPSNLLLSHDAGGNLLAKVADFGVAKSLRASLAFDQPRQTQHGELIGSPAFMSPEQLRGLGTVDARSDIWSLGVVAYEALTGETCFHGDTLMDVFATITAGRYHPASSVRPDLGRGVDTWLGRALALSPDARFESVGAMAAAFRASLAGRAPAPSKRRPIMVAGLAVALTLVGVSALLIARNRANASLAVPSAKASAAPAPGPSATPAVLTAPTAPTAPRFPVTDDPRSERAPRRSVQPAPSSRPAPSPTAPPPAVALPAVEPPPTAPPPAAVLPPAPPPERVPKRIDPSEIQ